MYKSKCIAKLHLSACNNGRCRPSPVRRALLRRPNWLFSRTRITLINQLESKSDVVDRVLENHWHAYRPLRETAGDSQNAQINIYRLAKMLNLNIPNAQICNYGLSLFEKRYLSFLLFDRRDHPMQLCRLECISGNITAR